MNLRPLTALAVAAAAVAGLGTPAQASYLCTTVYPSKDRPVQTCLPWGNPLPPLVPPCPVNVPDLLSVCEQ